MKKLLLLAVIALLSAACTINQVSINDARATDPASAPTAKPVYQVNMTSFTYWFFWFSSSGELNLLCTADAQGDLDCKK